MAITSKTPVMEGGPAGGGGNRIRRFPGLGGLEVMAFAEPIVGFPELGRSPTLFFV